MGNERLIQAKKEKNDEFYTRYEDIEKELQYYTEHFKDKVVYCNCDDARWSNFVKYFLQNFERLGLKKLISTGYNSEGHGVYFEAYSGDTPIEVIELEGDGDFRSEECKKILGNCDIVVSNPPFSLFKEFIPLLYEYKKSYIAIGNMNAITYKGIFPYIKENRMWFGVKKFSGGMDFYVPTEGWDASKEKETSHVIKGDSVNVSGCFWYTNLDHKNRPKGLPTHKRYMRGLYPKFDGTDIICINSINNIPCDYFGQMGVPITFFDRYDPSFWNILGTIGGTVNGREKYKRILIQRKPILNNKEVQNNV